MNRKGQKMRTTEELIFINASNITIRDCLRFISPQVFWQVHFTFISVTTQVNGFHFTHLVHVSLRILLLPISNVISLHCKVLIFQHDFLG